MSRLSSEDLESIRVAARALKRKMDELYGEELEPFREQHTRLVISKLVDEAEKRYLEEEGPLPEDEFDEMRRELRGAVGEIVSEEFGVTLAL